MNQQQILELLVAASRSPHGSIASNALSSLNCALTEKAHRSFDKEDGTKLCTGCLSQLLNSLFWGCLSECPEALPGFLPVFVMLCGEVPEKDSSNRLGQVNWPAFARDVIVDVWRLP